MERGDIGDFVLPGQACVFEGLLASPPDKVSNKLKYRFHMASNDWDAALRLWKTNDLPVKSLIDSVKRKGITTLVVTFLSPDAVEPIYRWLLRKGITTTVEFYESPEAYADDLRYNRSILNVYVPETEMAHIIGFRATVISNQLAWSV